MGAFSPPSVFVNKVLWHRAIMEGLSPVPSWYAAGLVSDTDTLSPAKSELLTVYLCICRKVIEEDRRRVQSKNWEGCGKGFGGKGCPSWVMRQRGSQSRAKAQGPVETGCCGQS